MARLPPADLESASQARRDRASDACGGRSEGLETADELGHARYAWRRWASDSPTLYEQRPSSPVARIPVGSISVRDGIISYTYRVAPSAIDRSSWCPGRYQLMVSPTLPNEALSQTRQAVQTHAAVYLHVC